MKNLLNKKTAVIIAGLFGFSAVALGAFGAHSLEGKISGQMIAAFKTGSLYHLIHSVVLIAVAFQFDEKLKSAFLFFSFGIILFSFSLYIYAITTIKVFAIITPFGGVSFLIGWSLIIFNGLKIKQ